MARDRMVTPHKLDRAESALRDLLDCSDIELARPLRLALKAVAINRQWQDLREEDDPTLLDDLPDTPPLALTGPES